MIERSSVYDNFLHGVFTFNNDTKISGYLKVLEDDPLDSAKLSVADEDHIPIEYGESVYGTTDKGLVSLINCTDERTNYFGSADSNNRIVYSDIPFEYTIIGDRYIAADEKCLEGIQFSLIGLESSIFQVSETNTFGIIMSPNEKTLSAVRRDPGFREGTKLENDSAILLYYSGDTQILRSFQTSLGTISIWWGFSMNSYSMEPYTTPTINIEFNNELLSVIEAIERLREIRQFFSWMIGSVPRWHRISVYTPKTETRTLNRIRGNYLDVYTPLEWNEDLRDVDPIGSLVDAIKFPDDFINVMQNWLIRNSDPKRKKANLRFFQNSSGISRRVLSDHIVSAVSMFDLLPDEDKPKSTVDLDERVKTIIDNSIDSINRINLGETQRKEVLSGLGRIKSNRNLRDTIVHRAKIVLEQFGDDNLKNLMNDIRLAVQCRHYYVHGNTLSRELNEKFQDHNVVWYFAKTLEFLYSTSELFACGWQINKSRMGNFHPYLEYFYHHDKIRESCLGDSDDP